MLHTQSPSLALIIRNSCRWLCMIAAAALGGSSCIFDTVTMTVLSLLAACAQANFHTDCRGMQSQLVALSSLMSILDPQLTSFLVLLSSFISAAIHSSVGNVLHVELIQELGLEKCAG